MAEILSAAPGVQAPEIAEAEAEQRLTQNRFDVPALVAKADHRFLAGDHRAAASFYAFAVKCSAQQGSNTLPADRAREMRGWLAERFRQHIVAGLETAGFPSGDWPPRFSKALAIMFGERQRDLVFEQFPQMPNIFFYPDLPYVDFVDPSLFPWRTALEACFRELRDEASTLLADTADFSPYVSAGFGSAAR